MLVILSGVETTNKKVFATEILSKMTSNLDLGDGYELSLKTHPYEIIDSSGVVVFRAGYEGDSGVNILLLDADNFDAPCEKGAAVLKRAEDLYNEVVLDYGRMGTLKDVFVDIHYDFGVLRHEELHDYPMGDPERQFSYQADIIDAYNNRTSDVYVITGSFGKHIIDRIRDDLGDENVHVLNIIRHPSVCFMFNEKPSNFYTDRTPFMDSEKLRRSLFNAIHLKSCEDITTVRYEDILDAGEFTIAGVTIQLPPDLASDNGFLTNVEKNIYAPAEVVGDDALAELNAKYSDFKHFTDVTTEQLELINGLMGTEHTVESMVAMLPSNVFEALGYEPMTRAEIINK